MYIAPAILYRVALVGLVLLTIALSSQIISEHYANKPIVPVVDFESCVKLKFKDANIGDTNLDNFKIVWNICDSEIHQELDYDDYAIRREKFRQQEFDERANLWLVVIITFSGVALAAFQLFMSYKLALRGLDVLAGDTKLLVEQGKIAFQSSVTGLSILFISLFFFVVYVRWIYMDQEIGTKPTTLNLQIPPSGRQLHVTGSLGGAPSAKPVDAPASQLPVAAPSPQKP